MLHLPACRGGLVTVITCAAPTRLQGRPRDRYYICCTYPLTGAAFMAVRPVVRPNLCHIFGLSALPNGHCKPLIIRRLQNSAQGQGLSPSYCQRRIISLTLPAPTGRIVNNPGLSERQRVQSGEHIGRQTCIQCLEDAQ